jgi:diguanylate cyclase (GGDEF)-like protein
LEPSFSEWVYLAAVLGCALSWLTGWLLGRRTTRNAERAAELLRSDLERTESQAREGRRMISMLQSEKDTVANLARSLQSTVRELNRSELSPRDVPQLVLNLATAIFRPGLLLFYELRNVRDSHGSRQELHLVNHQGLIVDPRSIQRIAPGQGKIGWVAQNRLDMLKEDWAALARTEGVCVEDNHPELELEIMGPLLHSSSGIDHVLGVLCMGSPGAHGRNEKLMFQMVTNLGSLALVNARNVTRLREQANHDGLTGLMNKRYFLRQLQELIVAAEKEAQPLTVFIFDIDHFKTYNDTNGHLAGDELLRRLAAVIRENLRPGDICCRYGGEEFLIVLPQTDGEQGQMLAESLRGAIESRPFPHQEKQPSGRLTISGGVAVFPQEGETYETLIESADQALYESKRAGRNRVTRARASGIGIQDGSDLDLPPVAEPDGSLAG